MKKIVMMIASILAGCISTQNATGTSTSSERIVWKLNATCNEEVVEASFDAPPPVFVANTYGSTKQFVIRNDDLGVRLYLTDADTSAQQALILNNITNIQASWSNGYPSVTLQGPDCFGNILVQE